MPHITPHHTYTKHSPRHPSLSPPYSSPFLSPLLSPCRASSGEVQFLEEDGGRATTVIFKLEHPSPNLLVDLKVWGGGVKVPPVRPQILDVLGMARAYFRTIRCVGLCARARPREHSNKQCVLRSTRRVLVSTKNRDRDLNLSFFRSPRRL